MTKACMSDIEVIIIKICSHILGGGYFLLSIIRKKLITRQLNIQFLEI